MVVGGVNSLQTFKGSDWPGFGPSVPGVGRGEQDRGAMVFRGCRRAGKGRFTHLTLARSMEPAMAASAQIHGGCGVDREQDPEKWRRETGTGVRQTKQW